MVNDILIYGICKPNFQFAPADPLPAGDFLCQDHFVDVTDMVLIIAIVSMFCFKGIVRYRLDNKKPSEGRIFAHDAMD